MAPRARFGDTAEGVAVVLGGVDEALLDRRFRDRSRGAVIGSASSLRPDPPPSMSLLQRATRAFARASTSGFEDLQTNHTFTLTFDTTHFMGHAW